MALNQTLLRVASSNPKFRQNLIRKLAAPKYDAYLKRKKQEGGEPLSREEWESYVLGADKDSAEKSSGKKIREKVKNGLLTALEKTVSDPIEKAFDGMAKLIGGGKIEKAIGNLTGLSTSIGGAIGAYMANGPYYETLFSNFDNPKSVLYWLSDKKGWQVGLAIGSALGALAVPVALGGVASLANKLKKFVRKHRTSKTASKEELMEIITEFILEKGSKKEEEFMQQFRGENGRIDSSKMEGLMKAQVIKK